MKELLVEKSKIKNNLKIINNIINENGKNDNGDKLKLIAVVKGNGYGLDLVQYSKFLADNGVKMFAVATVEEDTDSVPLVTSTILNCVVALSCIISKFSYSMYAKAFLVVSILF